MGGLHYFGVQHEIGVNVINAFEILATSSSERRVEAAVLVSKVERWQ